MRIYQYCIIRTNAILLIAGISLTQFSLASPALFQAQSVPQPLPEVRALLDKGKEAEKQSQKDAALQLYGQAFQFAQERRDRAGQGAALAAKGHLFLFDQPAQAQALYQQALPIYQEIGDQPNAALTLLMTGKAYQNTGEMAKAIREYEQALPLFEQQNDTKRLELAQMGLGECLLDRHETARAVETLEKALLLARENKDRRAEVLILGNMGTAYSHQGKERQAVEAYAQSLPLLEAMGKKATIASCLECLSLGYLHLGDFLKSLEYAYRALPLEQEAGTKSSLAGVLDILASNYNYIGQQEKGLEWEQQALSASQEGSELKTRAQVLDNLGVFYSDQRQWAQAERYAEQARDLYAKLEDDNGRAFSLYLLSKVHAATGDLVQAKTLAETARQLYAATKDQMGMATALLQSGDVAQSGGQLAEALADFQQALTLYQEIDDPVGEASALARIAALEENQGDLAQAQQFYDQALRQHETLRASLGNLSASKSHYEENAFPLYQRYIALLLRMNQNARAFEWTQRAKARTLIDLMKAENAGDKQTMTPAETRQAEELARRDKALSQQWLSAMGSLEEMKRQTKPDLRLRQRAEMQTREIKEINQQQQHLEADWRAFQEQHSLHNPPRAPQVSARTVALDEIGSFLPEDTALLEYVVVKSGMSKGAREEVVLFVVTQRDGKARLNVCRLKTEFPVLAQKAQALREACAEGLPYQELARSLYRLLVAPAEAALLGKQRLIFCPDGPLWDVPFQALLAALPTDSAKSKIVRTEFLWERYALSYAYSATEIKAALDIRQRPNRPKAEQALLVMANPDFGQNALASAAESRAPEALRNDAMTRGLYGRAGGLRALPYTRLEAKAILASFPNAALKTGRSAQEDVLKQTGANYRYLHLATHAVFNDVAPMLSGIVLACPPEASPEDGILTARELFDLNLGAEMLVLSACDTARGANKQGEGLIGLTWAAFAAGVPTQVVSQWSVDDEATAQLMGDFYHALKQGLSKDAALRKAALALLHDGKHQHPFYWAPFLLMGDWH